MFDCSHFLEGYSDFRDGLLTREQWESYQAHLQSCAVCARYDRVVSGGVEVFRALPELTPSADFTQRLQSRLAVVDEDARRAHFASGASLATTVGIALLLALIAWLPTLRPTGGPALLPPVMAHAPQHPEVVPPPFQPGPLLQLPHSAPLRTYRTGFASLSGGMPMGTLASYAADSSPRLRR